MPAGPAEGPEQRPPARAPGPDRVAALLAGFVGLLALSVSIYSTGLQRTQIRAQVWPRLEVSYTPEPELRLRIDNVGVGPARLKVVVVTVDGKPVARWAQVAGMLRGAGPAPGGACTSSTLHGRVVAAGAGIDALRCTQGELAAALSRGRDRVDLELCYCSVLDECWIVGPGGRDEPIPACPDRPVPFLD